jgi:hypothetical protein
VTLWNGRICCVFWNGAFLSVDLSTPSGKVYMTLRYQISHAYGVLAWGLLTKEFLGMGAAGRGS